MMGRAILLVLLMPFLWLGVFLLGWPYSATLVQLRKNMKPISLSRFPVRMTSPGPMTPWLEEQSRRKAIVEEGCGKILPKINLSYLSLARQRKKLFHHLVVDDIHKVLYCYIPKIACSNWKKVMMILSGKTSATDPKDKKIGNPHIPGSFYKLDNFNLRSTTLKLKNYKKFIFVRHPFERLVSAYRNKFEVYTNTSMNFKQNFGKKMVPGFKMGDPIPFGNFINYILKRGREQTRDIMNEHWATYNDLCHPCLINYDFIGYYDTIMEDAKHILHYIGAPQSLHFPTHRPANTSSLVQKYFSSLSTNQIEGLQVIYDRDFKVFGFDRNVSSVM